jgi:release factor glutamine methyltransferase
MQLQQAYQQLLFQLYEIYDNREAANIADLVIEHVSGQKKIDRILNRQMPLSEAQAHLLSDYTEKLLRHEPVQYVLHEAWFAGMKMYVDENVLIPRPETEELVDWIVSDSPLTTHHSSFTMLDIGTGSGCIAVALKKKFPSAQVHALDISDAALHVARQNAQLNHTEILLHKADILKNTDTGNFPRFDIIVSNPPYIRQSEAEKMQTNVFLYEPHIALFVPDENSLIFYEHISNFALSHLKPNGNIYLEINEALSTEVLTLFQSKAFASVQIKKDLQGKERMLKANFFSNS